jgi:hypothetical protein
MSRNFCFFKKILCPKSIFLEVLNGALFLWTLWIFLLGLPNLKNKSVTLNTSFHIDLGWFVGDLNMYYSKIKIIIFLKIITMSIWIILNNFIWTCKECNVCHYWAIIRWIHPTFELGAKLHEAISTHRWKTFTQLCVCKSPLILGANLAFV